MTKEQITEALTIVCSLDLDDDVFFEIKSVEPIRKDDVYGGYCVRLDAKYDTIITPLSIDISTGDIITPDAVKYEFTGIFDDRIRILLWGYNIETVMAEKIVKERIEGGANEKAVLRLFINCPFVCINFDFFWLNKARQLYMDF